MLTVQHKRYFSFSPRGSQNLSQNETMILTVLVTLVALSMPKLVPQATILTYHDVIPMRNSQSVWFDCTTAELDHQLQWMQAHGARFVSLDDIAAHIGSRALFSYRAIAITFADNYEGFWLRAWPIIKKRRIPVAMFVHTGYVGNREGRPKMTWAQLLELDRSGLVTVASQTVSHPADLGQLSLSQIRKEFHDSKRDLEAQLGHACKYLAYPNGKFDTRCIKQAEAEGYQLAFSEIQAPVDVTGGRLGVNRYVHTKWRKAWSDAENRNMRHSAAK